MSIIKWMSDTDYHAHPAIGSTAAKLGIDNTPLLKLALQGKYKVEDKPCFISGRLAHMAVLEPDRFAELAVCEGPINERTGNPYGRDTKAFQQWQEDNPHLTYVDPFIYDCIDNMPQVVKDIFKSGEAETSYFWQCKAFAAKCRPDWLCHERRKFWDLKTIATRGGNIEKSIDNAIKYRSYWFSMEWYKRVLFEVTGETYDYELVFIEKEQPNRWRIVDLDFMYRSHGNDAVDAIIGLIDVYFRDDATALDEDISDMRYQAECPYDLLSYDDEGDEL